MVKRLKGKVSAERFITATHTHCGPMVSGANPTLFGVRIPDDPEAHRRLHRHLPRQAGKAAVLALKDPKPAHLDWGVGSIGFAKNRRPQPNGPVDHELPVLVVRDAKTAAVRDPDAREPTDKDEAANVRGQMIADEVQRLADGPRSRSREANLRHQLHRPAPHPGLLRD